MYDYVNVCNTTSISGNINTAICNECTYSVVLNCLLNFHNVIKCFNTPQKHGVLFFCFQKLGIYTTHRKLKQNSSKRVIKKKFTNIEPEQFAYYSS